ncbi:sensor histidine kinase [Effusibacillus lacus]|uniref:Signal transduction histidine-protein kinase/phosphatase DegS n=1 Tax=Effusibacillus lacus TaxID=1348429 RepID=A0A292YC86_9BACL|nr:sensor histidine kinase [Effusibacillus lacus]TCS69780.1 two-component system sensor histidine kinase DegS [Effusibacillus lacus]GAX88862.1 histidine kinase [Effusibacillus lacus]
MSHPFDTRILDHAISSTLQAIHQGKHQIFEIAEASRKEYQTLERDVAGVQAQVYETAKEVDRLQTELLKSRHRLALVSRSFGMYTEVQMKEAYEEAQQLQTALLVVREREKQLRLRRDDLSQRLVKLGELVTKAESLVTQLSVALNYLSGEHQDIDAILESVEEKQYLGIRVIQAQEEERRRLAREIHDGPAQMMANVVLRSEIVEKVLDRDVDRVRVELRELKQMVRDSLSEVRQIIFDLRPMELDDLGLAPTLRRYLAKFQEKHGIQTDFILLGKEKRLQGPLEVAVFRSVQEALSNIRKHAEATLATVRLEMRETEIVVHIADNGKGFDTKKARGKLVEKGHYGLLGIKERIQLLGGRVQFRSKIGEGTKVIITLPISHQGGKANEPSESD